MNIAIIAYFPQPYGGSLILCRYICKHLIRLGVRLHVVDPVSGARKVLPEGISSYHMLDYRQPARTIRFARILLGLALRPRLLGRFFRHLRRFWRELRWGERVQILEIGWYLTRVLERHPIDWVYTHHGYGRSLAALIVAEHFGRPLCVSLFGSGFTMKAHRRTVPVARYVCERAQVVTALSQHTRRMAEAHGVKRTIEVVYIGVDAETFSPQAGKGFEPTRYDIGEETVILFVGWLVERKGPQVLMEALPRLTFREAWRAVFVGPDHGFKSALVTRSQELGLSDRVVISSEFPHEDLAGLYSRADIFVFPTITEDEGFGLVAAEAMACETPVVASRIGVMPEVVKDGETGFLFTPGDSDDLARKLSHLLNHEDLRRRLGSQGKAWVQEAFRCNRSTQRTLRLLEEGLSVEYRQRRKEVVPSRGPV